MRRRALFGVVSGSGHDGRCCSGRSCAASVQTRPRRPHPRRSGRDPSGIETTAARPKRTSADSRRRRPLIVPKRALRCLSTRRPHRRGSGSGCSARCSVGRHRRRRPRGRSRRSGSPRSSMCRRASGRDGRCRKPRRCCWRCRPARCSGGSASRLCRGGRVARGHVRPATPVAVRRSAATGQLDAATRLSR